MSAVRRNGRCEPRVEAVAGAAIIAPKSLPHLDRLDTMTRRARDAERISAGMGWAARAAIRRWAPIPVIAWAAILPGCASQSKQTATPPRPPLVLVVAPVLNLSNSPHVDTLKATDLIASECLSFANVSVVPVNQVLAELVRHGRSSVQAPEEAIELARVFHADATLVIAITEYRPYDPPVVGLVLQYYAAPRPGTTAEPADARPLSGVQPRWQLQRVFNAADERVLKELKDFADKRDGERSPYGWRKYTKSQELYLRYCGWALIRSMLALDVEERTAEPNEAGS